MSSRASLRRRIVVSVICYTVAVSLATTLLGYSVNERAEQRTWEALLQNEVARWAQRDQGAWTDSDALMAFGQGTGKPIPPEFRSLEPGVHDEVEFGGHTYVILVQGEAGTRFVMALEISEMENRESALTTTMILVALAIVALLAVGTYLGAQWLMRPLTQLSTAIRRLEPGARAQQVPTLPSDPEEIAVIAQALNEYLLRIDRFVERERAFLGMASHELRTPIAVIAGAAEVAIEQPTLDQARQHLRRILATSTDMKELVALLLALAKDPARLMAGAASVDLSSLVPRIVADHQHLMRGKDLTVGYGDMPPTEVFVPVPIAQAAIGNLIRNAIENGTRGEIRLWLAADGTLTVDNPTEGMSAGEMALIHARLARSADRQGDGIGLDLIARVCEHLGWNMRFRQGHDGRAIAELKFSMS